MSGARREVLYWDALLSAVEGPMDQGAAVEIMEDLDLPKLLRDERASMGQILRQKPKLRELLQMPDEEADGLSEEDALRRQALLLKLIGNCFGGPGGEQTTATQLSAWQQDVRLFEDACGLNRGALTASSGPGTGHGGGRTFGDADVEEALEQIAKGRGAMSLPDLRAHAQGVEKSIIDRMALREVLQDAELAAKLTPSMALTAHLLRDKGNLEGVALRHAKDLIRRFVQDLGDVLAREVASATTGPIDRSVPPKRTFRNLDMKRTIWANLPNWDPEAEHLVVDRLYYQHRQRKLNKTRLIVVVDQSGSMVPAMVNCTILASIFAGLPKVQAHLFAYDTQGMDLTDWVHDPLEVLLRTQLGGGTDGMCVVPAVQALITDPRNTVVAWISDFYDNRALMPWFTTLHRAGVTFIPVGSVSSSGYFSVDGWFRSELKSLGTPVLSGSLKTLIRELRSALP